MKNNVQDNWDKNRLETVLEDKNRMEVMYTNVNQLWVAEIWSDAIWRVLHKQFAWARK